MFDESAYRNFIDALHIPVVPQQALSYVLSNTTQIPKGMCLEFGVWNGTSIIKIAERFKDETVFGFDSFEGLPEVWERGDGNYAKGFFALSKNALPKVPSNVRLVKGWFNETLPSFIEEHKSEKIALLHVDCDLYSSTVTIFDHCKSLFQDKMVIVFDELINYPGYEEHELKAFWEFLTANPQWKVEWIGCLAPFCKKNPCDNGARFASVACRLVLAQ